MKREHFIKVGFFLLVYVASMLTLATVQWIGAAIKSSFYVLLVSMRDFSKGAITVQNYVFDWYLTFDWVHHALQSLLLTVPFLLIKNQISPNAQFSDSRRRIAFLFMIVCFSVMFVTFDFLSYLIEYLLSALIVGIISSEEIVTVENIVSYLKLFEMDFVGKFCEGFVATMGVIFSIDICALYRNCMQQ